jgi:transcriptional regulator with XRE-family HTH domain
MRTDRLKYMRGERGYTQEELAKMSGISEKQLWRYENGDSKPTSEVVAKISQALEVSADYLLGLVDQPSDHLREEELTPQERRALEAFRRGDIRAIIRLMPDDKPSESGD